MWKTTQPTAAAVWIGNLSDYQRNIFVKKLNLSILFLLLCMGILSAQRNLTLYNLNAVPQSMSLNPGRMPLSNVYVGIPALGSINGSFSNSSFTFGDLMLGDDEDFFENDFEDFLGILDDENRLIVDVNVNWLDFGFRVKNNFFSLQAGDYVTFQSDYPKPLFELFDDIANEEIQETKTYLLDQLGFNGTHFRSYGIGYTRVITPQLSMGIRAKYLSGMANVSTFNQNLRFVNDLDNQYFDIEGSLSIYSSGLQTLEDDPGAYIRGTGNRGFAIDFGANFQVNDQIEVYGSVVNLGRIRWKNDLTENTIVAGNVQFPNDDIDEFEEELSNFLDSLQMPPSLPLASYTTRLPAVAYFGGSYHFLPNTSASILFNPRFFEGNTDWAFSLGLQHRVNKFLQAVVNYSTYNKSAFNLGAGFALNAGPLQLYFASDNILPIFNIDNAKNAHFNTGLNLTFGRMTRTEQLETWKKEAPDLVLKSKMEPLSEIEATETEENVSEPEEKVVAEAETETAPKPEQSKKKQAAEKPAETTPEPEVLKPYLTFSGAARSNANESPLAGVTIELYKIQADGSEELALITSFLDGHIKATLQRSLDYRMVVKKPGFADQQIRIASGEMAGKNTLEKDVVLPVVLLDEQPKPATPAPSKPKEESRPSQQTEQAEVIKPESIMFKVLIITDLRVDASDSARSLFRLQKGNRVQLLEKVNDTWWKVQYVARVGYVKTSALEEVE